MLRKLKANRLMWLMMAALTVAVVAVACSSDPEPAPTAAPVDAVAIQTAVQQALQQALPPPPEQVSAAELQQMVRGAISEIPAPEIPQQVSPQELQRTVERAVAASAASAPKPPSASEISSMVKAAVTAVSSSAVTASEIQALVAKAVADTAASQPTPLSAEDVQKVVAQTLEASADPKETIVFADLNWNSAQLQNAIARFIVEKGFGYPTDAIFGATIPLWQGLTNGDIDVTMEIWLPNQKDVWEPAMAKGEVIPVGKSLDDNWQSAFVVPTYVIEGDPERGIDAMAPDLKTVADLVNYKDLFATPESGGKANLVTCVAGWACEGVNAEKVSAYGLDDTIRLQVPGSDAALFASLQGAYAKGDPWLGYMWGPTPTAAELDLAVLEEPDCAPGAGPGTGCAYPTAVIRIAVHPTLAQRAPEVIEFLRKWNFTAVTQIAAESYMSDTGADFAETAIWYLQNQEDVWTQWLPADVARKVKAALPSP